MVPRRWGSGLLGLALLGQGSGVGGGVGRGKGIRLARVWLMRMCGGVVTEKRVRSLGKGREVSDC